MDYIIVAAVFIIMMTILGTGTTFEVFFKSFVSEFGWTRTLTSGASSLREPVFGLIYIITAHLTDKYGPRIIVTVCALILGLGYFLMSQIHTAWQLYLFYSVIVAFGMSAYITMLSIVTRWFEQRRGIMTAIIFSRNKEHVSPVSANKYVIHSL